MESKTKLKELLDNYRSEVSLQDNKDYDVKISDEISIREFETLSDTEKAKVLKRIDKVDYMVASDIQNFASAMDSYFTKNSETIISQISTKDVGNIADPIKELLLTLKVNDPNEVLKSTELTPKGGVVSNIVQFFSLKSAKKKLVEMVANQQSIMENMTAIKLELAKKQVTSQEVVKMLEELRQSAYQQIDEFELDCVALQLLKEDAAERLKDYTSKEVVTRSELVRISELTNAVERIDKRILSLEKMRGSIYQTIFQMGILSKNEEVIYGELNEVITLVIPFWEQMYAIALMALQQKEALQILESVRDTTSKLITGNAKLVHDNLIAAQEQLHSTAIAVKDMLEAQQYLDDALTKTAENRKNNNAKIIEELQQVREINEKNTLRLKEATNS